MTADKTAMVEEAERWARDAHLGQLDRAGQPYNRHLERVANQAAKYGAGAAVAAWLHDAIEDTPITEAEIVATFGRRIARTVEIVTRRDDEPYRPYIARIANSGDTRSVLIKLEDIADHALFSPERLTPSLAKRYLQAYRTLKPIAQHRWRSKNKLAIEEVLERISASRTKTLSTAPADLSAAPLSMRQKRPTTGAPRTS